MNYSDIIKFSLLLPAYTEKETEMPKHIYLCNMTDHMHFIAKTDYKQIFEWKLDDDDPKRKVKYLLYTTNLIVNNSNADIILECYLPYVIIEKVGIHYSYVCPIFPFVTIKFDFRSQLNQKTIHYFDHNILDFEPKLDFRDKNKIKIFVFRPTFQKKDAKSHRLPLLNTEI